MPLPLTPAPHGPERKTAAEMVGEYLREAAVLVAVFAILDVVIEGHGLTVAWSVSAMAISLALLGAGIAIERLRKGS
jgi:hypothetical protein